MTAVAAGTEVVASEPAKPASRKKLVVYAILGAVAVGLGGWYVAHRGLEDTDDAQVDADVVGLSARTGGMVVKVLFEDNQKVTAGQVLAELDPEPAKARLAQAEANLEGARASAIAAETDAKLATTNATATNKAAVASLSAQSAGASASGAQINEARARVTAAQTRAAQTTLDLERVQKLSASGALSQAQLDQSKTDNDVAQASLVQAKANLSVLESSASQAASRVSEASAKVDQTKDVNAFIAMAEAKARGARAKVAELEAARDLAALELSYTKITAPQDAVVSKKNVAIGQMIGAGTPIAQMVPTKAAWVTANFKETQVGKMKPGQRAEIEVDALRGLKLHGEVESLSAATGARFALLPPDNATGNYTKIVQRMPVRVKLDPLPEGVTLRPGMSVVISVDTRK